MIGRAYFRLHWLCVQPTSYNDFLFRTLASDPTLELMVHFTRPVLSSHPWKTQMAKGFPSRTYRRTLGLDWHLLRLAITDHRSFFVVAGWHEPTMQAVINLLILRRRPFAIWTDTPNLTRKRSKVKAFLRSRWLRLVFSRANYIMGTGRPAREALLKMGCPDQKIVNLPFFVDLELFQPDANRKARTQAHKIIFASSGRLENAHKGHDLALAALHKAKQKDSGTAFCHRIAGTGPDVGALHNQAQRLDLSQQVEFVGWLEADQLPDFYRQADVMLHSSRIDPFPVAVLEGMASGLPVIGSDASGAVCDRVRHGINGFIHRSESVDELAAYVMHFLDHPEDIAQMGRMARKTAEEWPVARGVETVKAMLSDL